MSKEKVERNMQIFRDWKNGNGLSYYELADKYGIRHTAVIRIVQRIKKRMAANNKQNG